MPVYCGLYGIFMTSLRTVVSVRWDLSDVFTQIWFECFSEWFEVSKEVKMFEVLFEL